MTATCQSCARPFGTTKALYQHIRNSPAHATAFDCEECDREFTTDEALQQHLRDSPVHAVTFDCEQCDREFSTDEALQQHIRDSPAHAATFDCEECDREFTTDEALQQHLRDSPVHAVTFDCEQCDREFSTDEALQQHIRESLAHCRSLRITAITESFDMRPSLHQEVLRLLRAHGLAFNFHPNDGSEDILTEYDTSVMGKFVCFNDSCSVRKWTSKKVAITIRQYPGLKYNTRVYYQRCKSCNCLSRPDLDSSYAERISYRLAKWSGVALEEPPHSGHTQRPHQSRYCEGCRLGRCVQSRL